MITLIQSATGPLVPFLNLSKERHRSYCSQNGINYIFNTNDLGNSSPYWDKISLIKQWIVNANDGDIGIWMDIDSWIHNLQVNFSLILNSDSDLAARIRYCKGIPSIATTLFAFRKSAKVFDWLDRLWNSSDRSGYLDNVLSNYFHSNPLSINSLESNWQQWGPVYYSDVNKSIAQLNNMTAHIRAVHCYPKPIALQIMTEALK